MTKELSVAVKAAKEAGKIIMKGYGNIGFVRKKNDRLGNVTDIDFKAQEKIKKIILNAFPDAVILSEEEETHNFSDDMWIVDPLDGTNNFARGIKYFAVSIALMKNKKIVLGVVFDPVNGDLFHAEKGKGSFLNEKKILVSGSLQLENSTIDIGIHKREGTREKNFALFQKMYQEGSSFKHFGSAALQLSFVAAGWLDAFLEYGLFSWDVAAGILLVEEAGGKVTDDKSGNFDLFNEGRAIVASNGKIHGQILEALK
ncbi:MAG: inositol monophosphatase family protein [Candidatus ainarchaeum sp.]|nr:inositol monophosphatase family protein [Candidatus ainarchaeum sp.]